MRVRDNQARLCGAGEVCVYADVPLIQQPFWDVEIVTVPFAPGAELFRISRPSVTSRCIALARDRRNACIIANF